MPFHKGYAPCLRVTEGDKRVTEGDRRVTLDWIFSKIGAKLMDFGAKVMDLSSRGSIWYSYHVPITFLSPSCHPLSPSNRLQTPCTSRFVTLSPYFSIFHGVMKDDMGSPSKNNPETNKGFSASSQKKGVLSSRLPHRVCKAASVSINLC